MLLYCAGGEMLLFHAIHHEAAGFAQGFCSVLDNVQSTEELCTPAGLTPDTYHAIAGPGDIQLLWPAECADIQCWLPQ